MSNYKKSSTDDLLSVFAKAAAEQGEALRDGNSKTANSRYRTMEKAYTELKARCPLAQRAVLSLYGHPDGYVRLNAAAYSLEFDPPSALRVLRIIDKMETGLLGFTAGMIVKEWTKKHAAIASEVWIGTVEISYLDSDKPDTRKNAFTVVTTWACNAEEFAEKCKRMLESYGWNLLGVEKSNPASVAHGYSDEVTDMLERTRVNPKAVIYETFHTYPVM